MDFPRFDFYDFFSPLSPPSNVPEYLMRRNVLLWIPLYDVENAVDLLIITGCELRAVGNINGSSF
jgi:hypothetical protein